MNLNISIDLSKRLRDEIKMYQMQCRLNVQQKSQQSACNLDAFVNAALKDEKFEEFDCFEQ
jgi:hypothetical protein